MTILTLTKVDVGMMEDVGTSANQLIQLDSNAKIPAVDGSLLTGMSAASGSSDPTISTNPGAVGTKFINTTDGEIFICTDATAGENVWINVGAGTGNIVPYVLQGSSYGYCCGGYLGKNGPAIYGKMIEKYSFVSDGNATDVADMISTRRGCRGNSSGTHGYITGGTQYAPQPAGTHNGIERFPFASDSDSVDWADMTNSKSNNTINTGNGTYGFAMGGDGSAAPYYTNVIDRFPFATETNATDWADMTAQNGGGGGASYISGGYGYSLGGNHQPGGSTNVIEKFPFASQTNATDVGDITLGRQGCGGASSETHGFCVGGLTVGNNPNNGAPLWSRVEIDKHSFASGGNSVDHGDIPVQAGAGANSVAATSSTTHCYFAGGMYFYNSSNHSYAREQIAKFAYASNVTASDVGDLVDARGTGIVDWGQDGASDHQV